VGLSGRLFRTLNRHYRALNRFHGYLQRICATAFGLCVTYLDVSDERTDLEMRLPLTVERNGS
jgi:hypothetical protein